MEPRAIGLLAPVSDGEPPPPEALPFGRAALRLESEGVRVVVGASAREGRLRGHRAIPGGWERAELPLAAALDRFPNRQRPEVHRALLAGLAGVPVANPPALDDLCRDKLACQEALGGLGLPELEADPERFAEALARWGVGFHKPRFGALGHGVRRVVPGDPLPPTAEGAPGRLEPALLQRAVPPPEGWAGAAIRVLVQREGDGFVAEHPVVRLSRADPVVNAARGAQVRPLQEALPATHRPALDLAVAVAERLASRPGGELLVEVGVDLVVDPEGRPHPIEVNGKPRGRLEALAETDAGWREAHLLASTRPLRWLAERFLP